VPIAAQRNDSPSRICIRSVLASSLDLRGMTYLSVDEAPQEASN